MSGLNVSAFVPAPLKRSSFRRLWAGMGASWCGDRLQSLAQSWLMATMTQSAFGVSLIGVMGSLPLLLLPLGGVVAEQVDRRRLLYVAQVVGAAGAAGLALLVWSGLISPWHVYLWAVVSGLLVLVSRPAYKVLLTEAVPKEEARQAVAINSATETGSILLVGAAGSLLLAVLGLPLAFALNAGSFAVAAYSLWSLRGLSLQANPPGRLAPGRLLGDLRDGLAYLVRTPTIFRPLLMTLSITSLVLAPLLGLMAIVVQSRGGSIVDLGLFSVAFGVGSVLGATYAGARSEGPAPVRRYAFLAFVAAASLTTFLLVPSGPLSYLPHALLGFVIMSQSVWNTSRVRRSAPEAYQARLQSVTSMAFTLGSAVGNLWAGVAVDRFGLGALLAGAALLALIATGVALVPAPETVPGERSL